ncbi:MAG: 2-amino-4-hydroxy-6-hydroxymethyldihydropteridine diphosphokinase [Chloroflexi bacterium]|nr:2-amino-4-hydroxy-6-hydroxymethyldihydropteridine diphosphokinase [Chloroflexota bacterium]
MFLALGSNLGDRRENLRAAIRSMPPAARVLAESPVYETAPWGFADQPNFLNQVILAETDLPPAELLARLKAIEAEMGRVATFRNGPRLIDLDILFYGELIYDQDGLTIPHPRLGERSFVLYPLSDLAPDLIHPISGETARALAARLDASGVNLFVE